MRRQLGKDSGKTNVRSEDRVPGLEEVDAKKMPGMRKLSGAPVGTLGQERRQHLSKQGAYEHGAALVCLRYTIRR